MIKHMKVTTMMVRIMLGSHARVGKDTVADILGSDWQRIAIASPVHRAIAVFKEAIGDTTDEKYRDAMITIAERARAVRGLDIFIRAVIAQLSTTQDIVVTDLRKRIEYDELKKNGFIYVRVLRPGVNPLPSETGLDDVTPDYILVNDGTIDDLRVKVAAMLAAFK